ncbi:hypothetical protein VNO77_05705 [Canavalia gladiata]|uniref:Uncharacterized protein n=1 Tax=Canavalia gladiata TaxID=3824 RepID=A0AAN9RA94_CANGL
MENGWVLPNRMVVKIQVSPCESIPPHISDPANYFAVLFLKNQQLDDCGSPNPKILHQHLLPPNYGHNLLKEKQGFSCWWVSKPKPTTVPRKKKPRTDCYSLQAQGIPKGDNKNSQCLTSHFDSVKSETTVSKWARIRTMAAKPTVDYRFEFDVNIIVRSYSKKKKQKEDCETVSCMLVFKLFDTLIACPVCSPVPNFHAEI